MPALVRRPAWGPDAVAVLRSKVLAHGATLVASSLVPGWDATEAFAQVRETATGPTVPFDRGWLAVTHEVIALDEHHRRYLHRFVAFDRAFHVAALTEPLRLSDDAIEFAAGLSYERAGDLLHMGYGVQQDREAWHATLDAGWLRRALVAVP